MFGGNGYDAHGERGLLNDLWKYDLASGWWTWMSGSDERNQPGVYGQLGVPAPGNVPGGCYAPLGWADRDGNLWLFGGAGYDGVGGPSGLLNDLWRIRVGEPAANHSEDWMMYR